MEKLYILILAILTCGCHINNGSGERESGMMCEEDSILQIEGEEFPKDSVSEFTGLNDGYDFHEGNDIDSIHITCDYIMGYKISISKTKTGEVIDIFNEKHMYVSDFFTNATFEDIDALFIKKTVPVELSRTYTGYSTPDKPTVFIFETYINGHKQVDKIKLDPRYTVERSIRFKNLYLRLYNINRLLYGDNYWPLE